MSHNVPGVRHRAPAWLRERRAEWKPWKKRSANARAKSNRIFRYKRVNNYVKQLDEKRANERRQEVINHAIKTVVRKPWERVKKFIRSIGSRLGGTQR